ncbi:hypothetical protein Lalb_Chr23g0276191 [Lupinus albus]|uniref:Uncharacterized protein n=1 Tax=Lupinus albus TaxID=3870 RepID=A0A6A4NCU3_LUPAL|nr:hypothetical protein Lalb_Chr23g0276191 [Lupinus albus]
MFRNVFIRLKPRASRIRGIIRRRERFSSMMPEKTSIFHNGDVKLDAINLDSNILVNDRKRRNRDENPTELESLIITRPNVETKEESE